MDIQPPRFVGDFRDTTPYVLVVEDDVDARSTICDALTDAGFQALSARDGRTAAYLLRHARPAIILLDINMPGMSGIEFADLYHQVPEARAAIIVMTASPDILQIAGEVGAAAYLTKPFSVDELYEIIEQHMPAGGNGVSRFRDAIR